MPKLYEHMNISSIAAFLHIKMDESKKTQKELAREVGYDNPNILSMMKHGVTKVPFDKIPALAKALDVDVGYLMLLAIEQHWLGLLDVIKGIFGNIVSENEMALVRSLREAYRNTDPGFAPEQMEAALTVLKSFKLPPKAK